MNKNNFIGNKLAIAFVVFVLAFTACENPYDPDGGFKPDTTAMDCKVMATVVRMPYGSSIYGNLWLKTDDGKFYLPCEQSFITICPIDIKEGDRVQFGYRKLPADKDCLKGNPELNVRDAIPLKYQSVTIDCLQTIKRCGTPPPCSGLVVDYKDYLKNYITVLESKIIGNELKLKVGYSGCSALPNSSFTLAWKGHLAKSLPLQTELQFVINDEDRYTCQAYFTNDLCFDIAAIRNITKEPVLITIGENKILFK